MLVQIGNSAAKEQVTDAEGNTSFRDLPGNRVTTVQIPDSYTLIEAIATITAQDGVWNNHSQGDNPADSTPEWVESDNEGLALVLAGHYGVPSKRPKGWDDDTPAAAKGRAK